MSENSFLRDPYSSLYHRLAGACCCLTDLDNIDAENESTDAWLEYQMSNKQIKLTAITDFKRVVKGKTKVILGQIEVQRVLAEQATLPFFVCLTYLDQDYPVKMYYVVPANQRALDILPQATWMSLQGYSKFQHQIRNRSWNPYEMVDGKTVDAIKQQDECSPIKRGMYLSELPNQIQHYDLPDLSHVEIQELSDGR